MDHHTTWWSFLPLYQSVQEYLNHYKPLVGPQHFLVHHVFTTAVVVILLFIMALMVRGHFSNTNQAVVPPSRFGIVALFEMVVELVMGMMSNIMGPKNARRYFPLIGSLALYIFFSNLIGLIPGMAPPTDNLNTTAGCGIVVFLYYNYQGLRTHGFGHIAHMANPVGAWWGWFLAPLMFPIELVGHFARPLSLSLRLMGNMIGDHAVLFSFAGLVPILVPLPFYALGFLVCIIQTAVFCILSTVYIALAVQGHEEHEEHGHGEAHGHGKPAHAH
ncbi:MAG: F0F1 ATP synthase subunit A [Myxococcota bacterium]